MMSNPNSSMLIVASDSHEQNGFHTTNPNMIPLQQRPPTHQNQSSSQGSVAILWDIENCPVPSDVRPEDVAGNIRMALRVHPVIEGAVTLFSAYGDFNAFPRRLREGCQRTGVKLVDVPNGRKDAADKAILVDMFLFALDNQPPSFIMLISGDVDFAPALHILGQRGYTVILVIPSGVGVSSALSNAGSFVWDWPSVARGEGFVPPSRTLMPSRGGPADLSGYLMGCHISDIPDGQNEEEAIVYRGISQSYYNSREFSIMSQSLSQYNNTSNRSITMSGFPSTLRSQSLPCGLNDALGGSGQGLVSSIDQDDPAMWAKPGDLNGLRLQLVKLLELSGGHLPLARIPAEYQKVFGRPFYLSQYGNLRLVHLVKKMSETMAIEGKGQRKFVYLRNSKAGLAPNPGPGPGPGPSAAPPLVILRREDKKEKGTQEENMDSITGGGVSSDEFSDDEQDRERNDIDESYLEQFKIEVQEILVSYACRIFLGCFEEIYQQRYKRPLDYQRFGVSELEDVFEKVRDVVSVHEDPVSKRKFLSAVGG